MSDAQASWTTAESKDNITVGSTTRSPESKKGVRSRNGCNTCRDRKVKCDETGTPGGCRNCTSRGKVCTWQSWVLNNTRPPRRPDAGTVKSTTRELQYEERVIFDVPDTPSESQEPHRSQPIGSNQPDTVDTATLGSAVYCQNDGTLIAGDQFTSHGTDWGDNSPGWFVREETQSISNSLAGSMYSQPFVPADLASPMGAPTRDLPDLAASLSLAPESSQDYDNLTSYSSQPTFHFPAGANPALYVNDNISFMHQQASVSTPDQGIPGGVPIHTSSPRSFSSRAADLRADEFKSHALGLDNPTYARVPQYPVPASIADTVDGSSDAPDDADDTPWDEFLTLDS